MISNHRVYYEDTDAGGVVYYANYLKFAERARTELLRNKGINQSELDILFVVTNVHYNIKKPARLDDLISIETNIKEIKGPRIIMSQILKRNSELLVDMEIKLAVINKEFKPRRLPKEIEELLCMH